MFNHNEIENERERLGAERMVLNRQIDAGQALRWFHINALDLGDNPAVRSVELLSSPKPNSNGFGHADASVYLQRAWARFQVPVVELAIKMALADFRRQPAPAVEVVDLTDRLEPVEPWANVLQDVSDERARQVDKGYDAAHDDTHNTGEIAWQAAHVLARGMVIGQDKPWVRGGTHSRREELIIGIALAVAEVERLDREARKAVPTPWNGLQEKQS